MYVQQQFFSAFVFILCKKKLKCHLPGPAVLVLCHRPNIFWISLKFNRDSPSNPLFMRARDKSPDEVSNSKATQLSTSSSNKPTFDESPPHILPCHIWIQLGYVTTSTWVLIHLPLLSTNHFPPGCMGMCMFYACFMCTGFHHLDPGHREETRLKAEEI